MRAEVITIGNELITGLVVDSNSSYLGRRLTELGFRVVRITSVGDDPGEMERAFRQVDSDVVVVTGGLGPTPDDRTRDVFAEVVGRRLVLDEEVLDGIRKSFAHRGMEMPRSNFRQAMVPEGAEVLPNRWGTAPGLHVQADGRHFFLLPGVPREMKGMFEESVVPVLRKLSGRAINFVLLRTTGISESALYEKLSDLDIDKVAFLPGLEGVDLRVMWEEGEDSAELIEEIRRRAGEFVYAEGEEGIEEVVGRLLRERSWRIATAESCTGGLIGHRITEVPGSSDYFERGVVAYSNRAKVELLGVPEELIRRHGAVSHQVAEAMAEGIRDRAGVEVGLGVTGIAGPTGGTPQKPVGLVYIGVATPEGTQAQEFRFLGERSQIKFRTSQAALDMVRRAILGKKPPAGSAQPCRRNGTSGPTDR